MRHGLALLAGDVAALTLLGAVLYALSVPYQTEIAQFSWALGKMFLAWLAVMVPFLVVLELIYHLLMKE